MTEAGRAPAPVVGVTAGEMDLVPAGLPGTAALFAALGEAGCPVAPVDWDRGAWSDLEDRIDRDLLDAVERAEPAPPGATILGIGEAGLLALVFASLYPDRVARLVLVGTPVDLSVLPPAGAAADPRAVEGRLAFQSALSSPVLGPRFRHDVPLAHLPHVHSGTPRSGERLGALARTWMTGIGRDNRFLAGTLTVGERHADPGAVTAPILNVLPADGRDPLARSAGALALGVGSDSYEERALLGLPGDRLGGARGIRLIVDAILGWLDPAELNLAAGLI